MRKCDWGVFGVQKNGVTCCKATKRERKCNGVLEASKAEKQVKLIALLQLVGCVTYLTVGWWWCVTAIYINGAIGSDIWGFAL